MLEHPAFQGELLLLPDMAGMEHPIPAKTVLNAAVDLLGRHMRTTTRLESPQRVKDFVRLKLGFLEHEMFAVLHLDDRQRVIDFVEMFRGSLRSTSVYPREVAKDALSRNSSAVILGHNHPSGDPRPSEPDIVLTAALRAALGLVDVVVIDHLIVAGTKVVSLAEEGCLDKPPPPRPGLLPLAS